MSNQTGTALAAAPPLAQFVLWSLFRDAEPPTLQGRSDRISAFNEADVAWELEEAWAINEALDQCDNAWTQHGLEAEPLRVDLLIASALGGSSWVVSDDPEQLAGTSRSMLDDRATARKDETRRLRQQRAANIKRRRKAARTHPRRTRVDGGPHRKARSGVCDQRAACLQREIIITLSRGVRMRRDVERMPKASPRRLESADE